MLTADQLKEIADELVVLRFFMANALSTLPPGKATSGAIKERMQRLSILEQATRNEASQRNKNET